MSTEIQNKMIFGQWMDQSSDEKDFLKPGISCIGDHTLDQYSFLIERRLLAFIWSSDSSIATNVFIFIVW